MKILFKLLIFTYLCIVITGCESDSTKRGGGGRSQPYNPSNGQYDRILLVGVGLIIAVFFRRTQRSGAKILAFLLLTVTTLHAQDPRDINPSEGGGVTIVMPGEQNDATTGLLIWLIGLLA
jgi:hypothetical protein